MSKTIKLFFGIIVLFTIIASTGCSTGKEEDTPPEVTENYVTYDGTKYELSHGVIQNYGKLNGPNSYNTDLIFYNGFTVHESNGEIDSLSGTGHLLYFEMFSTQGDKLDIGDYMFDTDETGNIKTFDYGNVAINFNITTEDGLNKDIVSGKVTVVSNGAEYEISFNGADENNKAVTAYFKGALKYYNNSSKSASKKKLFK